MEPGKRFCGTDSLTRLELTRLECIRLELIRLKLIRLETGQSRIGRKLTRVSGQLYIFHRERSRAVSFSSSSMSDRNSAIVVDLISSGMASS
jgi:hypothetical protein